MPSAGAHPVAFGAFVAAMNDKNGNKAPGMNDTYQGRADRPVEQEPVERAATWRRWSAAAHEVPPLNGELLRPSLEYAVEVGNRPMQFHTTNGLVKNPEWEIGLQKTGYITEAGRCLVLQAKLAGRQLIMVFLDSAGKYSRIGDAERVRRWINASVPAVTGVTSVPSALGSTKPTI